MTCMSSTDASKKALGLYKQFLAANPKHALASKAANRAMLLLYSTGDIAGARSFAKKHSSLIKKAEADVAAALVVILIELSQEPRDL